MASSSSSSSLHTNRKLLQLSPPNSNTTSLDVNNINNDPTVQTCLNYCKSQENTTTNSSHLLGFCPQVCLTICPSLCHYSFPLSPNNFTLTQPNKPYLNHHSPLLISMLILLATTFLLITFYILYTKLYFHFYAPNNNNNNNNNVSDYSGHHRAVVFHPFWYISSVGLPETEIRRIAIVKYTKEMVEENNDCAVCLAAFEIGESLRVLPKCSHFFHIVCIDTWLSSHTSCPLCRAPVFSPDHLDHHGDDQNLTVEDNSSSVEAIVEDNSLGDDINMSTREEEEGGNNDDYDNNNNDNLENYCNDLRRVNNNNTGSFSQRWSLERGASNLLSRSLSCSGKIFSSSCCSNNSKNNNRNGPSS